MPKQKMNKPHPQAYCSITRLGEANGADQKTSRRSRGDGNPVGHGNDYVNLRGPVDTQCLPVNIGEADRGARPSASGMCHTDEEGISHDNSARSALNHEYLRITRHAQGQFFGITREYPQLWYIHVNHDSFSKDYNFIYFILDISISIGYDIFQ
jgi:hypothetical protein